MHGENIYSKSANVSKKSRCDNFIFILSEDIIWRYIPTKIRIPRITFEFQRGGVISLV